MVFISTITSAQRKKDVNAQPAQPVQLSPIEAKVKDLQTYPGVIEFYYDTKQDKVYFLFDKFDVEFLYIESLTAGVGSNDIGLDRNQLGRERIVKLERKGPKIFLVEPNYTFRAVSTNPSERKAVEEAFAQSVLWSFQISAEDTGKVLVDATDFLIQDAHDVVGTLRNTQQGSYSLDKTRSAIYLPRTKNFPQNSEFEVTLTFAGQPAGGGARLIPGRRARHRVRPLPR